MANGTTKNVYTDVFGGGPKFKIPSFSSKVEDYTDIFSSYHSGASSIPVLDLPVVGDDEIVDAQSLKFDYKEIFGGFDDDDDYAVPYQELFFDTKAEEESDSDEDVWTPAETGSPSGESSEDPVCLESNQPFSTVESPYAFDGVKQFNVSYHKTNQRSNDDRISGFTHIAQLNAVPAYTFLVDGDLTLQMAECNGQLPDVANSHSLNVNANDGAKDGERLWDATTAQPACADVLRTSESDQKLQINPDGNGTYHEKAFVTVTDVSLRTQPSEVPPPARPPPKFTIKQGCSKSMASDLKPSKNYARHGVAIDRSPPFFDVEVDASLSAAASAAAMKEAMDKAQARLKSAKELMEKRKDGPQYRKNLWLNEGSKGKERREGGIAHDAYRVNEENSHENFGKTVDSKGFDREERHKAVQGAQVESDVDMKERFLSVSEEAIDKSHVECRLTQGSKKQEEVIGEWKAEEQFYELVKQDTPGKVLVASKQKISEKNSMPTRVYEREQNERNAAEVVEFNNREEHEKKLKECIEREENEKQKKEALQREEKERRQRETYEREEKEKKQKALEREEKERRLREVREREEIERKQKALELEANERRQKEACEREENEKKQKALEREENERRQREAHEREENEKKQQAFEREENERRQREVLAREARVREQNEKRIYEKKLNEIKQREENERRQKQAHEREENENRINEKKQKEAHQREETQRRQKEALYIEENEKRLEEAREREEKERKLNEAAEENDGKLKDAHEQEENVKVPNVSHEQDKGEKRLKNPCEQEVTEKVLPNGKCETLGDEKKLRKPQKQKETEMNEVSHRWERNEVKLKKASELEDIGNGHIEACEREEKDNEVSQDFHLCSNEEKNLKPETVVQENVEYVTKLKAANNAPMQVEVENSKVTCDGCEQEENNVKLERAQESCTEKEYGKTVNTVQHASEHRENGNVLKVVELSCEQEANEQLRGACLAEDSPEYDDCENNKMAVPNPKLDGTEKKTGTLEETVTEEKDKRCSTENLVSLDCKERKKSIKEASGEGPCVENGMNAKVIQPIGEEYKTIKSKKADQDIERKETKLNGTAGKEEREKEGRLLKEREQEKERLRKLEEDIQREREKDRMAVERATREARERAYIEARERAERAAVERATAEARQRAMAEARERLEKACAEAREKSLAEKASTESRLREERTAVERATAEARERAAEKAAMEARERIERSVSEKFSTTSRDSGLRHSASFSDMRDAQFQGSSSFSTSQRYSSSTPHGATTTMSSNQSSDVDDPMDAVPTKGLTETCSPTFLTTGNPCLDFFFHILPDTPSQDLIQRLELAWTHNPLTALKLVSHLRGVRGTGKSDKQGFYAAALWLHEHHPKTLALNVRWFAEFGYLKDLLEILYRILEGLDVRKVAKEERKDRVVYWKRGKRIERTEEVTIWKKGERVKVNKKICKNTSLSGTVKKGSESLLKDWVNENMKNLTIEEKKQKDDKDREKLTPKVLRKKKTTAMAEKALARYTNDPNYQFLHDQISALFAELLSSDIKCLKSEKYGKVSLAAKWCPSLDSSYDRSTLICESIAKKVFPRDSDPEYERIVESHYAFKVRNRLRKQVLVPLRQALELPEIYMAANKWNSLPYKRVASVAMKIYKGLFMEHDESRFTEYLEDVKKGNAKIAAGALLPHEILGKVVHTYGEEEEEDEKLDEVAELQWKRMVEDLSLKGKFKNCLAVCDVSGSMNGTPMDVCIALGILLSELSEHPWKGKLITFSENPTLQTIKGETLEEKKGFVRDMDWGANTDFQKAFDLILEVAVKGKLNASKMVKKVFVFSDMEFDVASANTWETDYEAIIRKFSEQGYGSVVPEIVFWNLRDSRSTPVAATQKGVALVSGYSKNLLTLFLGDDGQLNPEVIMESAISGEEYKKLAVFD